MNDTNDPTKQPPYEIPHPFTQSTRYPQRCDICTNTQEHPYHHNQPITINTLTPLTPQQTQHILNLPVKQPNDANATTIGHYLTTLLQTIWTEAEGFNGKRPFGSSGWKHDIIKPLIKHKSSPAN